MYRNVTINTIIFKRISKVQNICAEAWEMNQRTVQRAYKEGKSPTFISRRKTLKLKHQLQSLTILKKTFLEEQFIRF